MTKKTIYPKLPKVFKAKWLEALRSGKFKQGQGELMTIEDVLDDSVPEIKYCCLGVGCKISRVPKTLISQHTVISNDIYKASHGHIPKMLVGDPDENIVIEKLVIMNDGKGTKGNEGYVKKHSFKEIANWIEKNL